MEIQHTQVLKKAIADFTGTRILFQPPKTAITNEKITKALNSKTILANGISVRLRVAYTSMSGNFKDRDVVLRRVIKGRTGTFLDVFCLDIQEPRLIKVQSLSTIYDLNTNRAYSNPVEYLKKELGIELSLKDDAPLSEEMEELKSAITLTRQELTAFVFMSAVDGDRDTSEYKEILNYVHARCPHLNFRDDLMINYLNRLYPDEESFYQACEVILNKEGWILSLFLETMIRLILADGRVDEKEKAFLESLFAILGMEGYKIEYQLKM